MTLSKSSSTTQQPESGSSGSSAKTPIANTATNPNEPQQKAGALLLTKATSTTKSTAAPTTTTASPPAATNNSSSLADSSAPLTLVTNTDHTTNTTTKDKAKKRGLFGFGKKKTDDTQKQQPRQPSRSATTSPGPTKLAKMMPGMLSTRESTTLPYHLDHPFSTPSSPGRALSASSPRPVSPAGSQIFERDVQESTMLPSSPAIPSHISTEKYIPPILDASSEAITDDHLSPDSVEIVTHPQHQPAIATITGAPSCENSSSAWEQDLQRDLNSIGEKDDAASNYGSYDSSDLRRLSFISFADVVQGEQSVHPGHHQPGSGDSIHLVGLTSLSSMNMNRSSSPLRSPVSSQSLGTSPPTSKCGSVRGVEMSPSRKPIGSPASTQMILNIGSEVNIETMTQALRRTASTDLGGFTSMPTSPIEGPSR